MLLVNRNNKVPTHLPEVKMDEIFLNNNAVIPPMTRALLNPAYDQIDI